MNAKPSTIASGLPDTGQGWNFPEFLFWSVLVGTVFGAGYLGIPRILGEQPGYDLSIGIETKIPYIGWTAIPYCLGYVIVFAPIFPFPQSYYMRRGAAAYLLTMAVSFALFLLIPVRCIPPPVTGAVDSFLLPRLPWLDDKGWNAFPSLHVAMTTLACLSLFKVSSKISVLSFCIWASVFASTLLLKRHYLVDGIAGTIVGVTVHYLVIEPEFRRRRVPWAF